MAYQVCGRVALVTGAASGIGLATCRLLLQSGAKIGAVDISSTLRTTCDALGEEFGASNIACLPCDVSDGDALTKEHFGSLDIVVNNAGIFDEINWEKLLKVNLHGIISGTFHATELISPDKGGVIVNVASITGLGLQPYPACPVYTAAKHGVVGFTKSMKINVEAKGARINCICPDLVDTPLAKYALEIIPEPFRSETLKNGMIKPEQIAEGIMELITDTSKSGAVLKATVLEGFTYMNTEP